MMRVAAFGLVFSVLSALPGVGHAEVGAPPLFFEQNLGQAPADILFLSRQGSQTLSLTLDGAILGMRSDSEDASSPTFVRMTLSGAQPSPKVSGREQHPGTVSYLKGSDASAWRTGIPAYGNVCYEEAYPGVDLLFRGNERQLEYDFIVKPGGDPARIALKFDGMERMELDAAGELVLHTSTGALRHHKPLAYQEINGMRHTIESAYVLDSASEVSFRVGAYDRSHALVIDPVLEFSTFYGGPGGEKGCGIGTDSAGNIYVGGYSVGPDFPTVNAVQKTYGGDPDDMMALKLDPSGQKVLYATYVGGNDRDEAKCMTVDAAGNAYLSGRTKSSDFPLTPNAFGRTLKATYDICVVKLNPTGDKLLYSNIFGGESMEEARGIAVDPQGNCTVVGGTHSPDFPTTAGSFRPKYTDPPEPDPEKKAGNPFVNEDSFVAKINPEGTAFVFCTFLGGHGLDKAWGCATDSAGCVYVTGYAGAKDFPTTPGAYQEVHKGGERDVFVTKFSPKGDKLLFSTLLGGTDTETGEGVGVDTLGNVYISGETVSANFPTVNPLQAKFAGGKTDAFLAKLSPEGDKLLFSTFLGGSGDDAMNSNALAVDVKGNVYVGGSTNSVDLPLVNPIQNKFAGKEDGIVARLNASTKQWDYVTYFGGEGGDSVSGIFADAAGRAHITGGTDSTKLPTAKAVQNENKGGGDVYIARISAP